MSIQAMAAIAAALGLGLHALSTTLAARRCRSGKPADPAPRDLPPVTIIQPLRGIETYSRETLETIYALDYPQYEIIFCIADAADPIAPLAREFIAAHPHIPSRLLVGDDRVSGNPKLNNVVKGWKAALHPWIIIADSNVLMPKDYITRLLSRWRSDTGIVCSPPIGSRAQGFVAELECAFLNTFQARWQYAGEAAGFGFAQGKTMLWRRDILDANGGIEALGAEIAEDAASTKLVHRAGFRAHLVDRPFVQPLGTRRLADIWSRQLRWAKLRRATFAPLYTPEIFTSSLFTLAAAALGADEFGLAPLSGFALAWLIWYGLEAMLAAVSGWTLNLRSPLAWMARDVMLPWLWLKGWMGDEFEWRGNAMTVADEDLEAEGAHAEG